MTVDNDPFTNFELPYGYGAAGRTLGQIMFRSTIMAIAIAILCAAGPATAVVTYHYSGQVNPTNTRGADGATYVAANAPVTFDFTLAAPLAANLVQFYVTNTLSWTAAAGSAESTISESVPAASLTRLYLDTNAAGTIVKWNIVAVGTPIALIQANKQIEFYFNSYDRFQNIPIYADVLTYYNGANRARTAGGVNCTNCGASGTFTRTDQAGAVPEPETWALLVAGLSMTGVAVRRRRRFATGSVA